MKSRKSSGDAQNIPTNSFRSDVRGERGKNGPSLAEIRQRAFEIHMERDGIHGCDQDDWLQAERELHEKYNKSNGVDTKEE